MADQPTKDTAAKGGRKKLLIGGIALLAIGAGSAFGAVRMGYVGSKEGAEISGPLLVRKGAVDPYPVPTKQEVEWVEGEGGSKYRTSYYSFEEPFTANLRDSAALIQVSLAASTQRDGRVLMWLDKHELAARSAIIAELANTTEEDAYSVEGKGRLQERLTAAINQVLVRTEGFGGVENVYFRGFLIQ
ncbi:flagellar basal body-associated FliL family protein [Croceicoccus sp. F390]|uniref:Flagellar protein FliL n=1 Tax=Croceicoccus esteveae TaxID=3075597 RepID=A0ABU2ZDK7_9SPHN|nr:flagellar basal body-associated FliL family protein [Croceicoccus sp. F390]MDT0574685.1 flagellar basal body-associated FliL family protein [Croceicoccus sp. F390]